MRKIKFRAWDKKKKRMHEVYEISWSKNFLITEGGDKLWLTNNTILLQLTGLKDKNGKEIYSGDLLRIPAKDEWEKTHFQVHEVFWHDNDCATNHIGWQMNRVHSQGGYGESFIRTMLPKYTKKMEIIGNIYENKELLK